MSRSDILVQTSYGEGRLVVDRARGPIATLLLGHGAGAGVETADLTALAENLPRNNVTVVRFEQPWVRAGRRVAPAPAVLDACFETGANRLRTRSPLVVGGRSAGARSAARTARHLGAAGCLALAFPLHPPGRPERSRLEELLEARVPTLVVQGERDSFGRPEEFPDVLDLVVVPGGDHSLRVPKRGDVTQQDALDLVVQSTLEWIVREVVGNSPRR